MDPLSLTGTLIAVIQISSKIVSLCYEYQASLRSANAQISHIRNEITGVRDVVERLLRIAEADNASYALPALQAAAGPDAPLKCCLSELKVIELSLDSSRSKNATSRLLSWPFKESEIRKSIDVLARIKSTLQLALAADQT